MAQRREKTAPRQSPNPAPEPAALPAPRFALAWAALVYALGTLSMGYPALAGRFLVNPHSDQYIAGYAFREFGAATLRATGHFPLWNPYLFGGMPYIAAMHGDIFYPTFLLRMIMPTDAAMTWGFIIHIFLAGLFTFCAASPALAWDPERTTEPGPIGPGSEPWSDPEPFIAPPGIYYVTDTYVADVVTTNGPLTTYSTETVHESTGSYARVLGDVGTGDESVFDGTSFNGRARLTDGREVAGTYYEN